MPTSKKGPDQPQRPSDPGRHSAPQPGPGKSIFTVIGENDTVSPPEPKRVPFPDDSIMPGSGMQAEPPSWQNPQGSGTYRSGITPESPSVPQTGFDNLPTDDWKLDELDQRGEPTGTSSSTQSPFAPPGVAQSSPFAEETETGEERRTVIPFPDESAVFMPPQGAAPLGTPGSATGFGEEQDSNFGYSQSGSGYAQSDFGDAQRDLSSSDPEFSEPGFEQTEEPAPTAAEQENTGNRSVPNSKQFREACLASSTADSAMANDNFKVAMPLYKKAHKQFKKADATDSQEFGNCLHKLADCYYHIEEYEEALAHYEEFIEWSKQRSTQPDVLTVVVNLKRARTFQKLDRVDDCDRAFHETVTMANRALPVSHPLFTVVYNSYISMLKFSGNSADKLKKVEERFAERMMTASRTVAIPEDLQEELSAWTDLEKADQDRLERNRQLKLSRHMFQNERSRPGQMVHSITGSGAFKTIVIVVVSLLLIGSISVMGFGAYMLLDQSGDKTAESKDLADPALGAYVGKVYKSADGLKTLTIKKDGTATFVFGNDSATFAAVAGAPKEGITEDLRKMMFGKNNYIVEEVQKGFRDKDGTILYAEDSKNLRITTDMQNIADLANYYYSRHQSQYPKKRKDFSEMGPDVKWENPLGQSIKPIIKAHEFEKYDGDVAFSENLDKYRKGKKIFEQDGKTGAPPGLIECLSIVPFDEYHTEDGVSFMVRAYDSNGKFLTSSIPGEVFVICQRNGVKHTVVKAEDIKSPVKDSSKTTAYFKLISGAKN
jgi:tetratricopeptide (TPR) repeat protein